MRTTRQRARQLNGAEVRDLAEAYQRGVNVNQLAARFGINRKTVSAHLARAGIARRYRILTGEAAARAAELYHGGLSLADVGAQLGVSANTVLNVLKAAGIERRSVGTNGS